MSQQEFHPWAVSYLQRVRDGRLPSPVTNADNLPTPILAQIFQSMLQSRLLDLRSRLLQAKGQSFYTIGSSGHEANAVVAHVLNRTDPGVFALSQRRLFCRAQQAVKRQHAAV